MTNFRIEKIRLDILIFSVWAFVFFGGVGIAFLYWSIPVIDRVVPKISLPDVIEEKFTSDQGRRRKANDFVDRPLFMVNRRPLPASSSATVSSAAVRPVVKAQQLDGLSLLGIFASGKSKGIILDEDGKSQRRLIQGEIINAWTLAEIEPRAAIFHRGNSTTRLELAVSKLSAVSSIEPVLSTVGSGPKTSLDQRGVKRTEGLNDKKPQSSTPSFDTMYQAKTGKVRDDKATVQ